MPHLLLSPARSFKVLAEPQTEQSLTQECLCLGGRSKVTDTHTDTHARTYTHCPTSKKTAVSWGTVVSSSWASQGGTVRSCREALKGGNDCGGSSFATIYFVTEKGEDGVRNLHSAIQFLHVFRARRNYWFDRDFHAQNRRSDCTSWRGHFVSGRRKRCDTALPAGIF